VTTAEPPKLSREEATARLTGPGGDFEIAIETIRGVRVRVWKNAPRSLRDILAASHAHGDQTFLVYEGEHWSFARHLRAAAAFARALHHRFGIAKGDRVAIAMRNYPEWSIAFWGAAAAGAIVVPLNAWWKGGELEYGLTDSGARFLVADEQRFAELHDRWDALPLAGLAVARTRGELPRGVLRFEDLFAGGGDDVALPEVELEPDDDATIFYTSGTTGLPKGALGTHRNICSNLTSLEFLGKQRELRLGLAPGVVDTTPYARLPSAPRTALVPPAEPPKLASLLTVPFFHVTGCHSSLVPSLKLGTKLVLVYKFVPEQVVELIERERITSFGGVPSIAWQVLEAANFGQHDLSSVLRIGYGGAPAAPDLVRRLNQTFPNVALSNGYGLTESSSVTSSNAGDDYLLKPTSVGPPVPVCEVKVVDDEGRALQLGEAGELWIKGPNIIKGYWNKPEATAAAITDGWLHSGDVAKLDDEGFIYLVDRKKDIVIRGGENVYCVEVEAALCEHPEVLDAAVFGVPHRVLGEEVAAAVKVRNGSTLTEEELRAHAAALLARFKVPVRIAIREQDFPRNPNGKILKRELRQEMVGDEAG
jgi:long-chain acyl-CoA synthetase